MMRRLHLIEAEGLSHTDRTLLGSSRSGACVTAATYGRGRTVTVLRSASNRFRRYVELSRKVEFHRQARPGLPHRRLTKTPGGQVPARCQTSTDHRLLAVGQWHQEILPHTRFKRSAKQRATQLSSRAT